MSIDNIEEKNERLYCENFYDNEMKKTKWKTIVLVSSFAFYILENALIYD